jgi:hypothetical protein
LFLTGHLIGTLFQVGRWDEAMSLWDELPGPDESPEAETARVVAAPVPMFIAAWRGDREEAVRVASVMQRFESSSDLQDIAHTRGAMAFVARLRGDWAEAFRLADDAVATLPSLGIGHSSVRWSLIEAIDATMEAADWQRVSGLLAIVDDVGPGALSPSLGAHASRARARLAVEDGTDPGVVDQEFSHAAGVFGELGMLFWRAVTLLEWAEWLVGQDREGQARAMLDEAREVFERLGAKPWLERLVAVMPAETTVAAADIS